MEGGIGRGQTVSNSEPEGVSPFLAQGRTKNILVTELTHYGKCFKIHKDVLADRSRLLPYKYGKEECLN